jgi:uncharacterized membrane protein YdjX (TVP38/TMEM64 family)
MDRPCSEAPPHNSINWWPERPRRELHSIFGVQTIATGLWKYSGLISRCMVQTPSASEPKEEPSRWENLLYVARRLGFVAPLAFLTVGLPILGGILIVASLGTLANTVRGFDGWAPWIFISGAALMGGLSLLPTHGFSLLGGYVFGFVDGVLFTMAGILCAAALGFCLNSLISRERVMGLISEKPQSVAIHRALTGEGFLRSCVIVILVRLSPAAPFAVTNLLMASTGMHWRAFLLGTAVGMLPRCAAVVNIGALIAQLGPQAEQTMPAWYIVGGIAATVAALVVIAKWSRRALAQLTARRS